MSSKIVSLLGETLLSSGGEVSTQNCLSGVSSCVLYFSAHWCPPCRGFTPKLAEAFKEYQNAGGKDCQVVFISGDRDEAAFNEYFAEMPWLAIPFSGGEALRRSLNETFEVRGIPSLVALNGDGEKLDLGTDLRGLIQEHRSDAFPMTIEHVKGLAEKQKQAKATALRDLGTGALIPSLLGAGTGADGSSLVDVLATFDHVALLFSDGDCDDATYNKIADLQKELNQGPTPNRLGVVYLGWTKYNADCDHEKLCGRHQEQFYGLLDPPQEVKEKLGKLSDNGIRAPHVVVLNRQGDGSVDVSSDDPGTQKIGEFGSKGYPWSDSKIQELRAEQSAFIAALKDKQLNLQLLKSEDGRDGLFTKDGTEVKVDTLASKSTDAVIGIYFSAHWCPPCRGFTPKLAECYQELRDAGKDFEVVFVSSDKDEDAFKEYMATMPWVAVPFAETKLIKALNSVFDVQGIPTLILLKPDGTLITSDGREAVVYGAEYFPWGPEDINRGQAEAQKKAEAKKQAAIASENEALEAQRASGGAVLQRLRGTPGEALSHDLAGRTIQFFEFATIGSPSSLTKSGIIYYEIEVVSAEGVPQIGFAGPSFESQDEPSGEGVGDDKVSWGFDGTRKLAWFDGETDWAVGWEAGDVIGFAANIDEGKIAVSKNGDWESAPLGVFFTNDAIKAGVFPCMTGGHGYTVRYNLNGSSHGPFKHEPPKSWTTSA